jgi:hypothetical protein
MEQEQNMTYGENRLVLVYDRTGNDVVEYRNFTNTTDAARFANERCARGLYAVTTKPSPQYV